MATLEQEGYRWRYDDGDEDAATWLANQDTPVTRHRNANTRLRTIINATGDVNAVQFRLEYRKKGTSDWFVVDTGLDAAVSSPSASLSPSASPSISPSPSPSKSPSMSPSLSPSASVSPSVSPSASPSISPSVSPSVSPSKSPSESPSLSPSASVSPSASPSASPSLSASASVSPSRSPSASPSPSPSRSPSRSPSISPSISPSVSPSPSPSGSPSVSPSASPSGGVSYPDIIFYWGCETTEAEKATGEATVVLVSDAVLNTDIKAVGTKALDCATGYDYATITLLAGDNLDHISGRLGFYLYVTTWAENTSIFNIEYNAANRIYAYLTGTGELRMYYWSGTAVAAFSTDGANIPNGGSAAWKFIEFRWNQGGAGNDFRIFVDGTLVGSDDTATDAWAGTPTHLDIGICDNYSDIHIDQVLVSNDPGRDLNAIKDLTSFPD